MILDIAYASEKIAETTEAAQEGVLASLGINAPLFIFQLINFLIVALIIWFLILKPLTKKLLERQKMIEQGLADAEKARDNLFRSEQNYQAQLAKAREAADNVLNQAQGEAQQIAVAMKTQAKQEIEQLTLRAKSQLLREKEEMLGAIKKETAGLVVAAVEKILEEKMTPEKDKKLIEETIKKAASH